MVSLRDTIHSLCANECEHSTDRLTELLQQAEERGTLDMCMSENEAGNTAITKAACYNNASAVELLLSKGADPLAITSSGRNAVGVAMGLVDSSLPEGWERDYLRVGEKYLYDKKTGVASKTITSSSEWICLESDLFLNVYTLETSYNTRKFRKRIKRAWQKRTARHCAEQRVYIHENGERSMTFPRSIRRRVVNVMLKWKCGTV